MTPRDVDCPLCHSPAGNSCWSVKAHTAVRVVYHKQRRAAAARVEADRDERQQRREWINDSGATD